MNRQPLVSGIIIFLNGENFLEEAIQSVLAQTYDRWELFLVDDGSTDRSSAIARRYAEQHAGKIHYLEHDGHINRGMSASRNLGLRHAQGDYIAFLDHDDVWLSNKLEEQVMLLEAHREAAMVYGPAQYWYSWTGREEDRNRDSYTKLGVIPDQIVKPPALLSLMLRDEGTIVPPCCILIRRQIVERLGGFVESFRDMHEDMVFWTKVYLEEPVYVSSRCWALYRQHASSCNSVAIRSGSWHPSRPSPVRGKFLSWVEQYVHEKQSHDGVLNEALSAALAPYHRRKELTAFEQVREVCLDAGFVIWGGKDASHLVAAVEQAPTPRIDAQAAAQWLFEGVTLVDEWATHTMAENWQSMAPRLEAFLLALQIRVGVEGMARDAGRILKRLVENPWVLWMSEGCRADLIQQLTPPDGVRVQIRETTAKSEYDVSLTHTRFHIRAQESYRVGFSARADHSRNASIGLSQAHEPWTNLGLHQWIELAPEWKRFEVAFTALATDDNARVHLNLGLEAGAIDVAALRVVRVSDQRAIEPNPPFPKIGHGAESQSDSSRSRGARGAATTSSADVPRISVIVPAYNAESVLADCLHALVEQEYPRDRYEILVVDNNSQDRTAEIIRKFPVTSLSKTDQQSSYAARNAGVAKAAGEILAFIDADCVADGHWLANAVELFRDPTVGCVAGHIGNTPPVTVVQEYLLDVLAQTDFLTNPFLPYAVTANVFYRKDVFDRIGPFEGAWISGGDADLAWRMQLKTPYRLTYCESATINHTHRRTRRAHFRQRWTWGYGAVLLYARYRRELCGRGMGYGIRDLVADYRQLFTMLWKCGTGWWRWRQRAMTAKEWEYAVLDCLSELGTRLGRIQGSIEHRVWYP